MSKMSELSAMIDNLISCGETLAETGRALKEFYSGTEEAPAKPEKKAKKADPAPKEAPAEKQYSKEEVRGILAKKADGRFKADVKAIVQKYGNGGSLTDVDAKDYAALVAEVEGLTDA